MLNDIGKYITKKIVEKAVKYGFWTLVMFFPGAMITTVGVTGVVLTGATIHSGIVEYGVSKIL